MGREVRMVPANWEHPKDLRGRFIPLLDSDFNQRVAEWDEERAQWDKGFRRDYKTNDWKPRDVDELAISFSEWTGERPVEDDYMPSWPAAERTHYMMYEDTSEGTPISPAFATAEELADWLAATGASSFGYMTATRDQWLATINRGFAPSAVLAVRADGTSDELVSGVTGLVNP